MRETDVTQFLIDITRGQLKQAYAEDSQQVIAASPLSEAMRAAVREQDIAALWLAGVSPMALLYFARLCGWSMERYYACIGEAELTKADQAGSVSEARREPLQKRR
ncbi:hypothetical protein [Pusillimonas noertemannii]|uniref:Aromatic-ring opening dioxygenase LigAB LigA subunit n=1 Tax=Pusillimonas noertemannii TaxID=305977 RepID=A0A2U1CMR1_9BURK|nr:hypothetical protein [Pusillimonas noertemannii]NYT68676.1 hypothetical protein [Pusillimonas noertemannii]PVY62306.1 aromatic-ring opening dioxygenase LigAB LigA subunit [Pusillimonas noertemannii]TFL10719.1 hypothetical protein CSC72_09365 [Pusillimonas noertemannii]